MVRETGVCPWSSHTKDSKMRYDAAMLNAQHYKVRIKGKVVQSNVENIKEAAIGSPLTTVAKFTFI